MKYFLSIIAIALLSVGLIASPAFAATDTTAYAGGSGLSTIRTITTVNNSGISGFDETNVSTTTYFIPTKCLLIGYHVQNVGTAVDGRVDIVDKASSTAGDMDLKIVSESEALALQPVDIMFPQGIRLTNGLTIRQGPMTAVTVYYIQDRP